MVSPIAGAKERAFKPGAICNVAVQKPHKFTFKCLTINLRQVRHGCIYLFFPNDDTSFDLSEILYRMPPTNECPLPGNCEQAGVIYQAAVTRQDNRVKKHYVGLTAQKFRKRH